MLCAINVPQSKSITIVFTSLKLQVFGLILTHTLLSASVPHDAECHRSLISFKDFSKIFFIIGLAVDSFTLVYFFCKDEFRKVEYYLWYVFHIILSIVCIAGGVNQSQNSCTQSSTFLLAIVFSNVIFLVNSLVVMNLNLFIVLKYVHFGCNVIWCILWVTMNQCHSFFIIVVGLTHGAMALVALYLIIQAKIYYKSSATVKSWKTAAWVSLLMMVLCYLLMLIDAVSMKECAQRKFFNKVYLKYGLLELISPLLILIFLRGQTGDPREGMIRRHDEVFKKLQQHENVDLNAKI